MKNLVVLSGAGISAESGLKTFRDSGGLWEGHRVEEVATPRAWMANRELVLNFYNERRRALEHAKPNKAHEVLAELEEFFNVEIITQNVDNLHERGGSSNITHLHGELTKARSTADENLVSDIGYNDIKLGDLCDKGSQLRPHIVWFEEAVPLMGKAIEIAKTADIFLVIGTSLQVYPAASLIDFVRGDVPIYLIDPSAPGGLGENTTIIQRKASEGILEFKELIYSI